MKEYSEQAEIDERMKKMRDARIKKLADKAKATYENKKWLFTKRCIERLSLDKIGELCGVEYDVIWDALKKLGIPIIIMVGAEKWYDWIYENKAKILALKS